jgi:hypothetical protein
MSFSGMTMLIGLAALIQTTTCNLAVNSIGNSGADVPCRIRAHSSRRDKRSAPGIRWIMSQSSAAALVAFRSLASRSITARHPALTLARCLYIHAETLEMLGISLPQSRKASPVHICCASDEKAKLSEAGMAIAAAAIERARAIWIVR